MEGGGDVGELIQRNEIKKRSSSYTAIKEGLTEIFGEGSEKEVSIAVLALHIYTTPSISEGPSWMKGSWRHAEYGLSSAVLHACWRSMTPHARAAI